jgi:hypothetical protein
VAYGHGGLRRWGSEPICQQVLVGLAHLAGPEALAHLVDPGALARLADLEGPAHLEDLEPPEHLEDLDALEHLEDLDALGGQSSLEDPVVRVFRLDQIRLSDP